MQLLTHRQIEQKIRRLAMQVMERNTEEDELIIAGINNNGMVLAELLRKEIAGLASSPIHLTRIRLNPAKPASVPIEIEMPLEQLDNKAILIVDDVANTGRTLHYATKPLLTILPRKIEIAVMIDRMHKSFPIRVDYAGLTLATTLQDNIEVVLDDTYGAFLN
jgi:pyrimidine operon attenuation protein/uracil phosphoribosyltransferase